MKLQTVHIIMRYVYLFIKNLKYFKRTAIPTIINVYKTFAGPLGYYYPAGFQRYSTPKEFLKNSFLKYNNNNNLSLLKYPNKTREKQNTFFI